MVDINQVVPDKEKSEKGVWVDITIPKWEGSKVKLASQRTRSYQLFAARARKPQNINEMTTIDQIDPEELFDLSIETMAEKIILDWEGLQSKGEEFPCTKENAKALLERSIEFYDFVVRESIKTDNFLSSPEFQAAAEDSLKKS
jgi:hypothetical protein